MIHTVEITYSPTRALYDRVISLPGMRWERQNKRFTTSCYEEYGLNKISCKVLQVNAYSRYSISMIVNLKHIVDGYSSMNIFTDRDMDFIDERFNGLMRNLFPEEDGQPVFPAFEKWKVTRIDYCVNVRTPYVKEYVKLLRKGSVPYFMKYPEDRYGRGSRKDGSLYLVGKSKIVPNRSITINFYDKQNQLLRKRKNGENWITDGMIEEAKDILRLEVQCHKVKTENLKKSMGISSKEILNYLSPGLCQSIIELNINRITPYAPYQRKSVAMEKIDASKHNISTKEDMKRIIEAVAVQHSSVSKVEKSFINNNVMKKSHFKLCIKGLEEMNVNPVTITDTETLPGKSLRDGLDSILDIFYNALWMTRDFTEDPITE